MYTLRTILTTNIVYICWLNKYIFAEIPILPPFSLLLSLGLWLRWYLWCFSVWTVRKCVINFTRKRPTIRVGILLFYFSKLWLYCCFVLFRFFPLFFSLSCFLYVFFLCGGGGVKVFHHFSIMSCINLSFLHLNRMICLILF